MTARFSNTSGHAAVAQAPRGRGRPAVAAALIAGVLAGAFAGCGGAGRPSAGSLVRQTFGSHAPILSGRIDLSLALGGAGSSGSPGSPPALWLRVRGPFQSSDRARAPSFALLVELGSAGVGRAAAGTGEDVLRLGASSVAGQLFIALDGEQYRLPASAVQALEQGYAQSARSRSPAGASSAFAALGIEPAGWLSHPMLAGSATIGGERTIHIVAGLDVPRFVVDVERLSGAIGALEGGVTPGSQPLSAALLGSLSRSLRSARLDVYVGARDHLLRRLSLTGATLTLVLELSELNRPQTITAPANPLPASRLGSSLQRLGLLQAPGRGG